MKSEYSYEERAAQAAALGLSYGKFMSLLDSGGKLPPQIHPIEWPKGSKHAHEVHVYAGEYLGVPPTGEKPPDMIPAPNQVDGCKRCGKVALKSAMFGIYINVPGSRSKGLKGYLCEDCFPGWIQSFLADGNK